MITQVFPNCVLRCLKNEKLRDYFDLFGVKERITRVNNSVFVSGFCLFFEHIQVKNTIEIYRLVQCSCPSGVVTKRI